MTMVILRSKYLSTPPYDDGNIHSVTKADTHETILASAERLLRGQGIAGARVADVMKGAGLTVGGFYAHFKSKQDLVDQALRRTAAHLRDKLFAGLDRIEPPGNRHEVVIKRYLSAKHRDAETLGCPFPAVVGEIATTAPEHGPVLAEVLEALIAKLTDEVGDRRRAVGIAATMIGGLTLARATSGQPISDEILSACRAFAAS